MPQGFSNLDARPSSLFLTPDLRILKDTSKSTSPKRNSCLPPKLVLFYYSEAMEMEQDGKVGNVRRKQLGHKLIKIISHCFGVPKLTLNEENNIYSNSFPGLLL